MTQQSITTEGADTILKIAYVSPSEYLTLELYAKYLKWILALDVQYVCGSQL